MKFKSMLFSMLVLAGLLASLAIPATPVSAATLCDAVQFVSDVTIPDGTAFNPGQSFDKTWRIKNIGSCTWGTDYKLVFASGEAMGAATATNLSKSVKPGETIDLTLKMTAPSSAGTYRGYWQLKNAAGKTFGLGANADKPFWVEIRVVSNVGTGYDFAANANLAQWASGAGNLSFPGTDGDANGFVIKLDAPKLETGTVDTNAGLLTVPQNTFNGFIQGSYPAVRVQRGDRFQSIINCEYGATNCYVNFQLLYQFGSGAPQTLWSFNERYEGLYYRVDLDLSSLADKDVKFILRVNAAGFASGDRALWGGPRIVRGGSTTPTNTPTVTPTPGAGTPSVTPVPGTCDRVVFVDDVTVPDGSNYAPGATFTKTWRLKNAGTCTWSTSYSLVFVSGDKLGGPDAAPMPRAVAPGQTVDVSVPLTAPTTIGTYRGYWQFKNASGQLFGIGASYNKPWWVDIRVITGTPMTPTPTKTPGAGTPTSTPVAGSCDRASFVDDLTVPDGANFLPGTTFTKTWRLKNVGTCTWGTSYLLVYVSGDKMGGPDSVAMPKSVAPGQTVDVSVNLTAPSTAGTYRGYWMFKNTSGQLFGIGSAYNKPWWVDIRVVTGTTLTPTPTGTPATPTPTQPSSTGAAYDFAASAKDAAWSSGAGSLPFPGTDGDSRGFVIKFDTIQLETGNTDNRSTLLTFPQNLTNGYIQGVYPAVAVKTGDKFQATIGCQYGATACYVTYRLDYQIDNGPVNTLWAFSEQYEGQVYNASVDLSSLNGKNVKFRLVLSSAGSPTGDRAVWVNPRIVRSVVATSTPVTATPVPTTPVPTTPAPVTPTPISTGNWALYTNPYGFSFKIPSPPNITGSDPKSARIMLPIQSGTTLLEKYIDVTVTENTSTCAVSTYDNPDATQQKNVSLNGITFLYQAGAGAAAGNRYDWIAYSNLRGSTCVSLAFVLHSANSGNYPTPPPEFDKTAESAIFPVIMGTFNYAIGPYAVFGVSANDVLNIRSAAGVSNSLIGSFAYNDTSVFRTGQTATSGGSTWVEVLKKDGGTGWVNASYLIEYVPSGAFCADTKVTTLLANFKDAVANANGTKLSSLVSPVHGMDVYYSYAKMYNFSPALAGTAFTSTTSYDWGAGPGGGPNVVGSFKDVIQPKLLDVVNNAGYTTYCETAQVGSINWAGVWPGAYTNLRYYSIYRPPTESGGLDWRTFVIGVEYIDGQPYITALMHFQWEP